MLGYIRTQGPELRLRDYEIYRALYCGLCRHMGKCTGQCSRFSLSYDFVFLAAVRISILNEPVTTILSRCPVHPLHKRKTVKDSETLKYCADASALLTYHKCRDDLADERGFKKMRARLALLLFSSGYRNAKKRYPELDTAIAKSLEELRNYETNESLPPSADAPAEIFGKLMESVFAQGLTGADARIAAGIGRSIGHWIYLADAADDFVKDRKSGSFNPFLRLFGEHPTGEDWEAVKLAMTRLLSDAECAFLLIDRFPLPELKEILCNILYLGLPETATTILNQTAKGESTNHEKSL